jgi:hypothetical protein
MQKKQILNVNDMADFRNPSPSNANIFRLINASQSITRDTTSARAKGVDSDNCRWRVNAQSQCVFRPQ